MRQESLLRLGAQIIHTSGPRAGLAGRTGAGKSHRRRKGWYYMDWLNNDDNPTYHRRVTGPALVRSIAREGPASWTASSSRGQRAAPSPAWAKRSSVDE